MHHNIAWAGEEIAQQVATQPDAAEVVLTWLVRVVPGGAITLLIFLGWAFRQRVRAWVVGIVKDVLKRGGGHASG